MAVNEQKIIRPWPKGARTFFLEIFPEGIAVLLFVDVAVNPFDYTGGFDIAVQPDKADISIKFVFLAGITGLVFAITGHNGYSQIKTRFQFVALFGYRRIGPAEHVMVPRFLRWVMKQYLPRA
jgi:hypothetical protein